MVLSEWHIYVPEITSKASKFKENNFPLAPCTITVPSDTVEHHSLVGPCMDQGIRQTQVTAKGAKK